MDAKPQATPVVTAAHPRPRGPLRWVWLGVALIGLSVAIIPFDSAALSGIASFAADHTVLHRVLKLPYHFFARWGFVVVPLVLLLFRDRWRLLIGFAACMAAGATVHGLKFLVGRARPGHASSPFDFHPFGDPRLQLDSFPSAHAVFAFMLAVLLGIYFPRWRPVFLLLTLMVCVARVAQERHYVSDVCAGAGFGIVVVHLVAYFLGPQFFRRLA
jgi:membrane-associated phospholipid phosphatase